MPKLVFSTTSCWDCTQEFGCASLGLAGLCDNGTPMFATFPHELEGVVLTGTYDHVLMQAQKVKKTIHAAIVLFGNAGAENTFIRKMLNIFDCPFVGGGAAIDGVTGRCALITGNGQVAVFLITDDRYTYSVATKCIHDHVLEQCVLTLKDARTIREINGEDAAQYLIRHKNRLGLAASDFEHLTLSDLNNVNAHLSEVNGEIKSGRDLSTNMLLRYVEHKDVYSAMHEFYDDPDAVVFGCAGLSGLLDQPLDTPSLGLFLFGEVCTVNGTAEFGNLMLSKLVIEQK